MLRVRRLVPILLVAALGATSLTGCRSNPVAAIYIGDKHYTNAYVEDLNNEIVDVIKSQAPAQRPDSVPYGRLRQLIVSSLVVRDVGPKLAAEHHVTIPKADPEIAATHVFGIPQGSPLAAQLSKTKVAKVLAEAFVAMSALARVAPAVEPKEADQREIYDSLVKGGQVQGAPFEQIQPYLTKQSIGSALGLRDLLTGAFHGSHVTVNPRYSPLSHDVPVTIEDQVQTSVSAPISTR